MSKRLNRAKCKLCNTIIVSRYRHDFVSCKCGEIFVDGGNDYYRGGAKDWNNFLIFRNRKWIPIIEDWPENEVINEVQETSQDKGLLSKIMRKMIGFGKLLLRKYGKDKK